MENPINEYLNAVCSQIHWKKYRKTIYGELNDHITDSVSHLVANGASETSAIVTTLEAMGDAEEIGKQLNDAYQPRMDKVLMVSCCLWVTFSFLALCSTETMVGRRLDFFVEAVIFLCIGILVSVVIFFADVTQNNIEKFKIPVVVLCITCLVVLYMNNFTDKFKVIDGVVTLIPILFCYISYKLREKKYRVFLLQKGYYLFLYIFHFMFHPMQTHLFYYLVVG